MFSCVSAFFILAVLATTTSAFAGLPPHIVFIVMDDLGWDDVGFRSHQIRTPNIDRLAAGGRILNHYYVQSVCSPSRAAFQTGRYPLHNTVNDWLRADGYLPVEETLIPQKLKSAGYLSHAVGKWHLGGSAWDYTPTFRGYSSFYGFYSGGQDYFSHGGKHALDFHLELGERCGDNCSQPQWDAIDQYSTTLFSSRAVDVIHHHNLEKPLFLYLAYQAVHAPREVPSTYSDAYLGTISDDSRREFAGMLTCADEGIGNVTEALKAKGMLANTLIVFTTDNGGPLLDTPGGDYVGSRNYPLRGGKHSIWEGGTRGTAFVWAGASTSLMMESLVGSPVQALMHGVDWLPTFCAVAGLTDCGNHGLQLDGIDMSGAIFKNDSVAHEYILYGQHDDAINEYKPYDDAIRDAAGWKLIQGWGGKPDSWSKPVNESYHGESELRECTTPSCAMDPLFNPAGLSSAAMKLPSSSVVNCASNRTWRAICFDGHDIMASSVDSPRECCAWCSQVLGCVGWTFHANATVNCFSKKSLKSARLGETCISGGSERFPTTKHTLSHSTSLAHSRSPSQTMLFNVVSDPGEHHDVAKDHPQLVLRLANVLNRMRATSVTPHDRLNCSSAGGKRTTPNGTYIVPWCNVTGSKKIAIVTNELWL